MQKLTNCQAGENAPLSFSADGFVDMQSFAGGRCEPCQAEPILDTQHGESAHTPIRLLPVKKPANPLRGCLLPSLPGSYQCPGPRTPPKPSSPRLRPPSHVAAAVRVFKPHVAEQGGSPTPHLVERGTSLKAGWGDVPRERLTAGNSASDSPLHTTVISPRASCARNPVMPPQAQFSGPGSGRAGFSRRNRPASALTAGVSRTKWIRTIWVLGCLFVCLSVCLIPPDCNKQNAPHPPQRGSPRLGRGGRWGQFGKGGQNEVHSFGTFSRSSH